MLERVKLALRIVTDAFDDELNGLIEAASRDLGIAGVINVDRADPMIILATCIYCQMHFGSPDRYDQLKASYDEIKSQLATNSNYTDFYSAEVY